MAGLQQTTAGNRVHIGIFGRRNAGKSSVINRLTRQQAALVSDVAGTTTDPVFKAMEILPIGPVMIIDTAGVDDSGDLGALRVAKTREVMSRCDVALVVAEAGKGWSSYESELLARLKDMGAVTIAVMNKADTAEDPAGCAERMRQACGEPVVAVSAATGQGFDELRTRLIETAPRALEEHLMLGDLVEPRQTVVFCVPIDSAAPKGRLILPQVQAIRDTLDRGCTAVMVKEDQLAEQIANMKKPPALVVTDSQVFSKASAATPAEIPLTSFSILMARMKGDLPGLVEGARRLDELKPGDRVLIAEACTHLCQAEDIGRVKIPNWLRRHVGGDLNFTWYTGNSFPEDVSGYRLVIHCGACMINRRAMLWRQRICREAGVPVVNYGIAIARMHGILERALSPLPDAARMLHAQ